MLFKKCEKSAVDAFQTRRQELTEDEQMFPCFFCCFLLLFVLVCLFFFVQGRLCFHIHPLTHVHVTDLGAAAGRWAAPLEQSPAVKVPCWRALWQWLLREDWAFLDLFTFPRFVPGIRPVTFSSWNVTTFLLTPSILLWPTSLLLLVLLFNSFKCLIFIFVWTLWFWNGDARAMRLSTSAYIFISIVLLFLRFSVMDFLQQSTRRVSSAPLTLASSVPVLGCGCKVCVILVVTGQILQKLWELNESLSCSDYTSCFYQHACAFFLVLCFFRHGEWF